MNESISLKGTLQNDLHDSMRAKDKVRSGTLRMTLTAVTNAEVAGKEQIELSDQDVLKVIAKEAKKRKEAATAYTEANRPELAAIEEAELVILQSYLPAQLDDATLDELATAAVAESGASGMAQIGAVMKVVQPKVAGRADGGRVAAAVRKALQG